MTTTPTRIVITEADRCLLPFHPPTAQRVLDDWNAAFAADMYARREVYKGASLTSAEAAHYWTLTEQYLDAQQVEDAETMAAIEAEAQAYVDAHENILAVFLDVFDSEKILAIEDLRAAYTCLWGAP